MKREHVTTVAEVASAVSITVGVAMLSVAAAFIVAGGLGLLFLAALTRRPA